MVFRLGDENIFPHPDYAEDDGLLAIGGDLSPERLIQAYASGIFPWFNSGDPILWWSPNPRPVFTPGEMKVSKSLRQSIKKKNYQVKYDHAFGKVLELCAKTLRNGESGTWLTKPMRGAYQKLHEMGIAHSVEIWENDIMVGGLYGVALGRAFFGESMFHLKPDASKVAFYYLDYVLKEKDFHFIDGQVVTEHLLSLGAKEVKRDDFLKMLSRALEEPTIIGHW